MAVDLQVIKAKRERYKDLNSLKRDELLLLLEGYYLERKPLDQALIRVRGAEQGDIAKVNTLIEQLRLYKHVNLTLFGERYLPNFLDTNYSDYDRVFKDFWGKDRMAYSAWRDQCYREWKYLKLTNDQKLANRQEVQNENLRNKYQGAIMPNKVVDPYQVKLDHLRKDVSSSYQRAKEKYWYDLADDSSKKEQQLKAEYKAKEDRYDPSVFVGVVEFIIGIWFTLGFFGAVYASSLVRGVFFVLIYFVIWFLGMHVLRLLSNSWIKHLLAKKHDQVAYELKSAIAKVKVRHDELLKENLAELDKKYAYIKYRLSDVEHNPSSKDSYDYVMRGVAKDKYASIYLDAKYDYQVTEADLAEAKVVDPKGLVNTGDEEVKLEPWDVGLKDYIFSKGDEYQLFCFQVFDSLSDRASDFNTYQQFKQLFNRVYLMQYRAVKELLLYKSDKFSKYSLYQYIPKEKRQDKVLLGVMALLVDQEALDWQSALRLYESNQYRETMTLLVKRGFSVVEANLDRVEHQIEHGFSSVSTALSKLDQDILGLSEDVTDIQDVLDSSISAKLDSIKDAVNVSDDQLTDATSQIRDTIDYAYADTAKQNDLYHKDSELQHDVMLGLMYDWLK